MTNYVIKGQMAVHQALMFIAWIYGSSSRQLKRPLLSEAFILVDVAKGSVLL